MADSEKYKLYNRLLAAYGKAYSYKKKDTIQNSDSIHRVKQLIQNWRKIILPTQGKFLLRIGPTVIDGNSTISEFIDLPASQVLQKKEKEWLCQHV